ncbi:MAG TPA: hypothetical protein VK506_10105 [Conexibacter sp.]|nr:hypothetical protein [Conexibacter sp.]
MVTLLASFILGLATSSAWAVSGIGLSTGGRAVLFSSGRIVFAAGVSVTCPVTLTGTFASGLEATAGVLPGRITRASLGSCSGGSVRLLTETLPWFVHYYAFSGTLPSITGLTLGFDAMAALVEIMGVGCLFSGDVKGTTIGTPVREFRLDETVAVPIARRLSILCADEGTISGTFNLSPSVGLRYIESVPGATMTLTPNPMEVLETDASRPLTATAVGGTVRTTIPARTPDPNRFAYSVTGCVDTDLNAGQTCVITVGPNGANRPTRGTSSLIYLNEHQMAKIVDATTIIR